MSCSPLLAVEEVVTVVGTAAVAVVVATVVAKAATAANKVATAANKADTVVSLLVSVVRKVATEAATVVTLLLAATASLLVATANLLAATAARQATAVRLLKVVSAVSPRAATADSPRMAVNKAATAAKVATGELTNQPTERSCGLLSRTRLQTILCPLLLPRLTRSRRDVDERSGERRDLSCLFSGSFVSCVASRGRFLSCFLAHTFAAEALVGTIRTQA
jgi:hypothetical protein